MRIHFLIEQLADEDLETFWNVVYALHCDLYTIKAIQEVKRSPQPWDTLTHEEAVRLLILP